MAEQDEQESAMGNTPDLLPCLYIYACKNLIATIVAKTNKTPWLIYCLIFEFMPLPGPLQWWLAK